MSSFFVLSHLSETGSSELAAAIVTTGRRDITRSLSEPKSSIVKNVVFLVTVLLLFLIFQMTSVERILEYCNLEPEAPRETDTKPPAGWPAKGEIEFDKMSFKYHKSLPRVLHSISCCIKPHEKVTSLSKHSVSNHWEVRCFLLCFIAACSENKRKVARR